MIKYNKPCPIKYDGGGKTYTPKNPVGEQAMVAPIAVGAGNILPWVLGGLGITGATAHVLRNLGDVNFDFTLPKMIGMMGLANSYAHLTSGAQEAQKSESAEQTGSTAQAAPETPKNEDDKKDNSKNNENPKEKPKKKSDFRGPIQKSIDEWKKLGRGVTRVVTSPWTYGILATSTGAGVGSYKALSNNKPKKSQAQLDYEQAKQNKEDAIMTSQARELNREAQRIASGNYNTVKILIDPEVQKELESMYEQKRDSLLR